MPKPKVSICLVTFNGVEYLSECLASCLNQTYKNIEVIVVNGGSTDSTQDIIDYYHSIDPRLKGIATKNEGISMGRQRAVEASKGDYIAIIDTDCRMDPNRIQESLDALGKKDIVYTDYYMILPQQGEQKIGYVKAGDISKKTVKDILDRKYPNSNQIVPNFTILAKRECFKGVYRSEFVVNDDLPVIVEWLKRGYKFVYLKVPLMMHFSTGYNVSNSKYDEVKKITDQLRQEEGI